MNTKLSLNIELKIGINEQSPMQEISQYKEQKDAHVHVHVPTDAWTTITPLNINCNISIYSSMLSPNFGKTSGKEVSELHVHVCKS